MKKEKRVLIYRLGFIFRAFLIRKKMSNTVAITSIGDILCEMVRFIYVLETTEDTENSLKANTPVRVLACYSVCYFSIPLLTPCYKQHVLTQ